MLERLQSFTLAAFTLTGGWGFMGGGFTGGVPDWSHVKDQPSHPFYILKQISLTFEDPDGTSDGILMGP